MDLTEGKINAFLLAINRMKDEADAIEKIKDSIIKSGVFYYAAVILEKEEVEMLIQAIYCELSEMGTAGDRAGYEALLEKLESTLRQTGT